MLFYGHIRLSNIRKSGFGHEFHLGIPLKRRAITGIEDKPLQGKL
jgi:hypothetical protein